MILLYKPIAVIVLSMLTFSSIAMAGGHKRETTEDGVGKESVQIEMDTIPIDVLVHIFSFSVPQDIGFQLKHVNKKWHSAINSNEFGYICYQKSLKKIKIREFIRAKEWLLLSNSIKPLNATQLFEVLLAFGDIHHRDCIEFFSIKEILSLFQRTENPTDPWEQNNLGFLYHNGYGVIKDEKKAMDLYILAADQGNYAAKYNLGRIYEEGNVVEKSYQKAADFYMQSLQQKETYQAYENLARFYKNGYYFDQNETIAAEYDDLASKLMPK